MLQRDFDPSDVQIKCRICDKPHPKGDFPTLHRVCRDCALAMGWKLKH